MEVVTELFGISLDRSERSLEGDDIVVVDTNTYSSIDYVDKAQIVEVIDHHPLSEDDMMMMALDAGAEDVKAEDEVFEITTAPSDFSAVRDALEGNGLEFLEASVEMVPQNTVELDEAAAEKMQRLIDNLEDNDDVMNVYSNWADQ